MPEACGARITAPKATGGVQQSRTPGRPNRKAPDIANRAVAPRRTASISGTPCPGKGQE